ncbi:MAG: putative zinc-binding metallopeptidase [Fulvivirga sp.]|uniref:putative zinc-binding metallopeptidase n=1 Tax=Fulvivirga sp. TaxID=1931237 RepID=UPI0032EDD86A
MDKYLDKIVLLILIALLSSCYEKEELNVPVKTTGNPNMTELDQYIQSNFTEKYGMAIRYRFVDRYVNPGERVTPPRLEVVRPMLDFIEDFWIGPYIDVQGGEAFFEGHVPAEIVFLGGLIYNEDGTVTLGTADAGAQITFTDVNSIDPSDVDWRSQQLNTVYHEFAHIVHQRYKLPAAFETIAATGYTSPGSWFNLPDEEALARGFVSPYATSSPNEDFAETVAYYLFYPDFTDDFLTETPNCESPECVAQNEGKALLQAKISSISEHYEKVTGINLKDLREAVQSRL